MQQNAFQQFINALPAFCRYRHKLRIATVFFRQYAVRDQFLFNAFDIRFRLIDLIQRHHQRHVGGFRVMNSFDGLRHHAVIGGHHENNDIGDFRAARTHRGKRFVARRIEEGDHAARRFHVVSADVLGNPAGLTTRHTGAANIVQQRRFTVIDVTHHGYHRRARFGDSFNDSGQSSFRQHGIWVV